MRIALTEFVTLDGVSQGPGSPTEDTSDGFTMGSWLVPHLDDPYTARMNALPKYVVTSTLIEGTWHPTTVLRGDPVRTVGVLRLVVAPTVIGSGRRLLDHPGGPVGLSLVHHEVTGSGLLLLEYEAAGAAPVAEYDGVAAFV